jgi:twitching motility two-component system response regulator PilG
VDTEQFRLLIVEDSATIRHAYRCILGASYDITFAEEALTALRLIATTRPDVVILDVNLKEVMSRSDVPPGTKPPKKMDGLHICAAIKRSPFKMTPIIMLTSRDGIIDRVKGKLARADLYMTKPIKEDQLQRALREFLYGKIMRNRMQRVVGGPSPYAEQLAALDRDV